MSAHFSRDAKLQMGARPHFHVYAILNRFHFFIFPVIEHLPQELRDRFTDMREMDLSVQSMFS